MIAGILPDRFKMKLEMNKEHDYNMLAQDVTVQIVFDNNGLWGADRNQGQEVVG